MWTFRPDYVVKRFIELEPAALVAAGIRAVIVDLDNTLWAADTVWLDPASETALRGWLKTFPGKVAVVTNKLRRRDATKLWTLLEQLPLTGLVTGPLLKPLPFAFWRAARLLNVSPPEILVVGDFYLADILGGKLAGMNTALTSPLGRDEGVVATLARPIDTWIAASYRHPRTGNPN
ncbi:HAD hydrolase-like protein [Candidatus Berkelbacteria bacterium]|nr:HAD hydrolase-like protein [Candidatus Berkelbacteria bacterium]